MNIFYLLFYAILIFAKYNNMIDWSWLVVITSIVWLPTIIVLTVLLICSILILIFNNPNH